MTGLTNKNRYFNPNPYGNVTFGHSHKKQRTVHVPVAGRSSSAPPAAIIGATPAHTVRVTAMGLGAWTDTTTLKIRLAYNNVDVLNPGMQGLVITRPELVTYEANHGRAPLKGHFEAVADLMEANHKVSDATEGTGEAAAALGVIVDTNATYQMLYGFDTHRGAGIDQIWGLPNPLNPALYTDYLIVEAKGPGQVLTDDPHRPNGMRMQMSHDWIIDNLARMNDAIGDQVLNDVGLATHVAHAGYGGGSKSYYGVAAYTPATQTATLSSYVVTARWTPAGAFGFTISNRRQHY